MTCSFATDVFKLTDAIEAINAYRAQNGLPAYTVNTLLVRAAQRHANDMACNDLFVHTGTDGSTPQTRVAATGYVATSISENVYGSNPPLDGTGVVNLGNFNATLNGAYGIVLVPDLNSPIVNTFSVTSPSSSLDIPITNFTASDGIGVTGYMITESSTAPDADAAEWMDTAPST